MNFLQQTLYTFIKTSLTSLVYEKKWHLLPSVKDVKTLEHMVRHMIT